MDQPDPSLIGSYLHKDIGLKVLKIREKNLNHDWLLAYDICDMAHLVSPKFLRTCFNGPTAPGLEEFMQSARDTGQTIEFTGCYLFVGTTILLFGNDMLIPMTKEDAIERVAAVRPPSSFAGMTHAALYNQLNAVEDAISGIARVGPQVVIDRYRRLFPGINSAGEALKNAAGWTLDENYAPKTPPKPKPMDLRRGPRRIILED